MKIIFSHGYFLKEDPKEQAIMRPYMPLGILYISAFLESHGYENTVFDSTFSSFGALCDHILSERPRVIGLYTNLMTKLNILRIIHFIKSNEDLRRVKIVLGGPEVRNHMANFLLHGADFIVFGEGEQTMLELVQLIDKGEKTINEIDGIAYKDEKNNIQVNRTWKDEEH